MHTSQTLFKLFLLVTLSGCKSTPGKRVVVNCNLSDSVAAIHVAASRIQFGYDVSVVGPPKLFEESHDGYSPDKKSYSVHLYENQIDLPGNVTLIRAFDIGNSRSRIEVECWRRTFPKYTRMREREEMVINEITEATIE